MTEKELVEQLRADMPEKLCEKHWVTDFDAVEAQRSAAADMIESLSAEVNIIKGRLKVVQKQWAADRKKMIALETKLFEAEALIDLQNRDIARLRESLAPFIESGQIIVKAGV